MKKILFAASAIAIAMGMASCSDYFLDLNPTDQQTEANFYKTPEEFEAAANSTYSFYGFGDVSETVNGTKYTSSYYDMLDVNSDILAGINPVAQGILAPSTNDTYWSLCYAKIRKCNVLPWIRDPVVYQSDQRRKSINRYRTDNDPFHYEPGRGRGTGRFCFPECRVRRHHGAESSGMYY